MVSDENRDCRVVPKSKGWFGIRTIEIFALQKAVNFIFDPYSLQPLKSILNQRWI